MRQPIIEARRHPAIVPWIASALAALGLVGTLGCDEELSGPAPSVPDAAMGEELPLQPGIVCRMQHSAEGTPVIVSGSGLSPIAFDIPDKPRTALPTLTLVHKTDLGGGEVEGHRIVYDGEPGGLNAELLSWQSQSQMTFLVRDEVALDKDAQGMLPIGVFDIQVDNPNTSTTTSKASFAVTDRPHVDSVTPGIVCLEQGERQVTLAGQTVLRIGDGKAVVRIEGTDFPVDALEDCTAIPHGGIDAEFCSTVQVTLPQGSVAVGFPDVLIQNPETAACVSVPAEDGVNLRVVPPPTITEVVPPLICVAEGPREVIVRGTGFLEIDGALPAVTMDGAAITVSAIGGGCETVDTQGHTVQSCTEVTVEVPQNMALDAVLTPTLELTNPAPAGCSGSSAVSLVIAPPPVVEDIQPALVCLAEGDRQVVITGSGFLFVDGVAPTVMMDEVVLDPSAISDPAGCEAVAVQGFTDVQRCSGLTVTLSQGSLVDGMPTVVVTNPDPAGCSSSVDDQLTVFNGPTILNAEPAAICQTNSGQMDITVHGLGFLRVDGEDFTVTFAGDPITPSSISECEPLAVDGLDVETCSTFVIEVDTTGFPLGGVEITVTNPAPSECGNTTSGVFVIAEPPVLTGVMPSNICENQTETITLSGQNFVATSAVFVGTTEADTVEVNADGTVLTATFEGTLVAGDYDVTVSNGAMCDATLPNAISVEPTPLVFFVDPPVLYNGIEIEATVFTTGLAAAPATVELIDANGDRTSIMEFTTPDRPNRILATIPAGLAPGTWEVSVTSEFGCESSINGRVVITDALTLALEEVDPSYVSPSRPTGVTLRAATNPPNGQVGFESTPRAYLSPVGIDATATALRAMVFESASELTAVVPANLTPGAYDLVVVNPSGAVGLLSGGITVTGDEPPEVSAIVPASIIGQDGQTGVSIQGNGFDPDPAMVDVSLDCQNFSTGMPTASNGTVTVTAATETTLTVTINAGAIGAGAVCVVTVTNADGSFFRYSALSTTNSSRNLNPWRATGVPNMLEARRAPVLEAGRPTSQSRFLYAVGGDGGATASAKASVEATGVDAFGDLVGWEAQRNTLSNAMDQGMMGPMPRTFAASARIGRFLYVTGGHDGAGVVDTTLRAEILDPLAGPEILDLDAQLLETGTGIDPGRWFYRVAATFPDDDPSNPAGESLPGEVLTVEIPDTDLEIALTLTWERIPGANGYHVYRSPVANDSVDNMQLLTTITNGDTVTWEERGGSTDAAITPLPQGSLGVWHTIASLGTPRMAHATVAVQDDAVPTRWYLYAVGGRDGANTLASGEFLTVTVAANGSQTFGAWQPLTASLTPGRSELPGFVMTRAETTLIPQGETYVYFGPGWTGNAEFGDLDGGRVGANGDIMAFTDLGGPNPGQVGAAGFAASGYLYLFGGQGRTASRTGKSGQLQAPLVLPSNQWDSLGNGTIVGNKIYAATSVESAFAFIAGGADNGNDNATAAVEQTIR